MKTIWTILHLDTPTNDIDVIKQAYSKLTKSCNPEENPEEFQELHNAYKQALKYARSHKDKSKDNSSNTEINNEFNILGVTQNEKVENNNNVINNIEKNIKENKEENTENDIKDNKDFIKENTFNELNDIEESNVFDNISYNDNQDLKISEMMIKIDNGFRKSKKALKEAVNSEQFMELLDLESFQLILSMYLNDSIKLPNKKIVIIEKACKLYLKKNKKLIPSLKNFFDKYKIRGMRNSNSYVPIVLFALFIGFFSSINNNDYNYNKNIYNLNNTSLNIVTKLNNNEIVYSYKTKVILNYPEGYNLEYNTDYTKRLKKDDIKIKIQTKIKSNTEDYYTELQKNEKQNISEIKSEVSSVDEITVNGITYQYATVTEQNNNSKESTIEKHIWSQLNEEGYYICFVIENPDKMTEAELNELLNIKLEQN